MRESIVVGGPVKLDSTIKTEKINIRVINVPVNPGLFLFGLVFKGKR